MVVAYIVEYNVIDLVSCKMASDYSFIRNVILNSIEVKYFILKDQNLFILFFNEKISILSMYWNIYYSFIIYIYISFIIHFKSKKYIFTIQILFKSFITIEKILILVINLSNTNKDWKNIKVLRS